MTARSHPTGKAVLFALFAASSAMIAHAQTPVTGTKEGPPSKVEPAPGTPNAQTIFQTEAQEKGVFNFDYGVPASPSLNLLGQPEDKVTVVNGLKPFIIQLPRVLGGDNQGGQSVGLDFSPAWLLGDDSTQTYDRYTNENARLYRILTRTHVGVALYEGVADADPSKARPSRIALGLSTSLFDTSDPLMATRRGSSTPVWQECLNRNAGDLQRELNVQTAADLGVRGRLDGEGDALDAERDRLNARIAELTRSGATGDHPEVRAGNSRLAEISGRIDVISRELAALDATQRTALQTSFARSRAATILPNCAREANLVARYGASLGIGIGALWNGDPGRLRSFSSGGWVGWASLRVPLQIEFTRNREGTLRESAYWMIGFSGRGSIDEIVATNDPTTPHVRANILDGWAGVERFTAASRLAVQVGYQVRDTEGRLPGFDRERLRYFASFSQRIGREENGLWLRIGYGHVRSSDDDDEALSVSLLFAPPAAANLFGTN